MRDPFAAAVDALFHAPGSAAAEYFAGDLPARPIRVILGQPDQKSGTGRGRIVKGSIAIDIRRSDVLKPVHGDVVALSSTDVGRGEDGGATVLRLHGEPMLDTEGLTWTCGAVPAT